MGELLEKVKRRLFLSHLVPFIGEEFKKANRRLEQLERQIALVREAVGRVESRQVEAGGERGGIAPSDLAVAEFSVYSQWGEDGIIQHLLRHVTVPRRMFVEFGVESYREANTRFLLINDNWSGLVIDGSPEQVALIRKSREYWLYNLKAAEAFVTRENINELLTANGVSGPIGLLSIDIDGMDWWVWEAITAIEPAIVVIEYNYRFGPDESVIVPYDAAFDRRRAHHSILYYGASLEALCRLGRRKGYAFVGAGSAGLNAFFVRRDLKPEGLPELSAAQGYIEGQFCEAHDAAGVRIKMSNEEQRRLVFGLPLVRVGEDGFAL